MNDYERVAKAIAYLEANFLKQPDLTHVAIEIGLSPHYFHRLFASWAGATPKNFLQCLTLQHARKLLIDGESVLDAALESGLSGPGRLHDLCVNLEAASPGEIKTGGAGMTIAYGVAETPFGLWLVGESERGICHASFEDSAIDDGEMQGILEPLWFGAILKRNDQFAEELSARVFRPDLPDKSPPLRACVQATEFQLKVWRALLRVPTGSLISYGRLAELSDAAGVARAVGTAVGQNQIACLIPCHRVIRGTGVVGRYRWGPERKRTIIAREALKSLCEDKE